MNQSNPSVQTDSDALERGFIFTSQIILTVTASAKIVSAMGTSRVLLTIDHFLGFSYRNIFWTAGALELAIVVILYRSRSKFLKLALLAWLSTVFLFYRIATHLMGSGKACSCLGALTDAISISEKTANNIMWLVFLYLLAGSYALLIRFLLNTGATQTQQHCEPPTTSHGS